MKVSAFAGKPAEPSMLVNPNVAGSSRQGCNPTGESPATIIVRFGHVAIPQFWKATSSPSRGVNALAARRTSSLRGGCNLGGLASMGA
jgi:hypothetical protein